MRVVIPVRRRVHRHRYSKNSSNYNITKHTPTTLGDAIVMLILVITFMSFIILHHRV